MPDETHVSGAPDTNNAQGPADGLRSAPAGPQPASLQHLIIDTVQTLAIALGIFFIMYTFIAQPHLVKGESMQPNYHDGEYILTSKLYKWFGEPERGDVVVLKPPKDPSVQYIKRIIALPGEKIRISDNTVYIYNDQHPEGRALSESYLSQQTITAGGDFLPDGEIYTVPADDYMVMGDNRAYSYDSRSWGNMPKGNIIGKAFFVYWPIPDFGFVAHAEYGQ